MLWHCLLLIQGDSHYVLMWMRDVLLSTNFMNMNPKFGFFERHKGKSKVANWDDMVITEGLFDKCIVYIYI